MIKLYHRHFETGNELMDNSIIINDANIMKRETTRPYTLCALPAPS